MANPHSTVKYVEPNYTFDGLTNASSDGNRYDRAPDLEDYCIALDIEVELSSRDKTANISNSENRCIVMSYRSDNNGESKVRFLSGSRIGGHHRTDDGKYEPNLKGQYNAMTTVYADMYTYDLTDYGTTELLGIKSVDVEYNSSFVPVITIKFTDVRGMSLMQPSELSHLSLNGINGVPADNLAQSFFQSFFSLPFPLFRVHLKGFYGNPVSYQVMCDKFETSFNSQTGDFDVTTRFVGFAYSFMADISFNVLMAAPYSDYGGSDYWNSKNFKIKNAQGQLVVDMPKLFDLRTTFKKVVSDPDSTEMPTSEGVEADSHDEEISKLNRIKDMCTVWYNTLSNAVNNKDLTYKLGGNENSCSCVVVMAEDKAYKIPDFNRQLMNNEDFRIANNSLYNAIEEYNNSSEGGRKLKNVKKLEGDNPTSYRPLKDMVSYKLKGDQGSEFSSDDGGTFTNFENVSGNPVSKIIAASTTIKGEITGKENYDSELSNYLKLNILNNYNDVPKCLNIIKYTSAYVFDAGIDDINERIQNLINDKKASGNGNGVSQAAEQRWYEMLTWYPTIENFTRIVMAHVETLMHIFYKVQKETIGKRRTIEDLGISIDKLVDLPKGSELVGPFPRVTEYVTETGAGEVVYGGPSYGMTRKEDVWIGDYSKGDGIREADMVNGILNGINYMHKKIEEERKDAEDAERENNGEEVERPITNLVAPLTTYDFFLKKNPYVTNGNDSGNSNISNIPDFAGMVFVRMMGILGVNAFAYRRYVASGSTNPQGSGSLEDILTGFNGIGSSVLGELAGSIGRVEAYNFAKFNTISGEVERALGENGTLTSENIIKLCTTNKLDDNEVKTPWGEKPLSDNGEELWVNRYSFDEPNGGIVTIQPIQNISFNALDEICNSVTSSQRFVPNEDICYVGNSYLDYGYFGEITDKTYYTHIVTEDYNQINKILEQAQSGSIEDYKRYANLMGKTINQIYGDRQLLKKSRTAFDSAYIAETSSIALIPSGYDFPQRDKPVLHDDGEVDINDPLYVTDNNLNKIIIETNLSEYNKDFIEESYNRNINSFTISEVFLDRNDSLLLNPKFYNQKPIKDFVLGGDIKYTMAASFLFGIDGFNYDEIFVTIGNICSYLPKVVMLQIGAYLAIYHNDNSGLLYRDMERYDGSINYTLFKKLGDISLKITGDGVYIQYFRDWVDKNYSKIEELYVNNNAKITDNNGNVTDIDIKKIVNSNYAAIFSETKGFDFLKSDEERKLISSKSVYRLLLNPESNTVRWLSKDLLSTVCFMCLSVAEVNAEKAIYEEYAVQRGFAINYLDGFLEELRKIKSGDVDTTGMQLAMVPEKTSNSMKIELYRQLKVVYDKWVCSTKESDWDHLKFFEEGENYDNPVGNSFFFIDSFYNKMNHALMNPYVIAQKVDLSLTTVDVRVMLANFLSEVYGMHNFMMKCVNNFRMLTKYMDDLFLTHPFNRMPPEKVLPDFVLIYAYEASKYADIPNGEYANDGFMLNDEDDTPLPITSRSDEKTYFKIPAFGVSYGRQYQHFFKTVNVDMGQPAATEQATVSKYAILANSRGETYRGVSAQDAFDIYSNQSYTCKFEMMGCAYIQPLMYFVLLNVPFFRGSYLISKVSHHIVPGDMSTTVTGVRMSKYCNHLVRKMLSDQDYYGGGSVGGGGKPYIEPKVDNDCPYKVFPVGNATGSFNGDPVPDGPGGKFANSDQGKKNFCIALFHSYISAGVNPALAKILVSQDAWESGYGSGGSGPQYYNYGGIVCNGNNCIPGSQYRIFNSIPEYVNYKITKSLSKWPEWKNAKDVDEYLKAITSGGYRYFTESYDVYSRNVKGCESRVLNNLKGIDEVPNMTDQQKEEYNNNFGKYFVEAIKKSYESLPSSGGYGSINPVVADNNHNKISIIGGKLSILFDIILNGYYQYVDKLYWVYTGSPKDDEPAKLDMIVKPNSENKANTNRRIYITDNNKSKTEINATYPCHEFESKGTSQLPESFLNSIVKCYVPRRDIFKRECPQLNGCERIFSTFYVKECGKLEQEAMQKANRGRGGTETPYSGKANVPTSANIMIDNWNVKKAIEWLVSHAYPCPEGKTNCGIHQCATFVENAIAGCNGDGCKSTTGLERMSTGGNGAAKRLWYNGILKDKGFEMIKQGVCNKHKGDRIPSSDVMLQPGDVAIIDNYGKYGHACMWSGEEWISDYHQGSKKMSPYSSANGNYPYAIFRYHAKDGKVTVIQG